MGAAEQNSSISESTKTHLNYELVTSSGIPCWAVRNMHELGDHFPGLIFESILCSNQPAAASAAALADLQDRLKFRSFLISPKGVLSLNASGFPPAAPAAPPCQNLAAEGRRGIRALFRAADGRRGRRRPGRAEGV